jgi:hypothetical protein
MRATELGAFSNKAAIGVAPRGSKQNKKDIG